MIVSRYTEKNFFKPVRYCMSSFFTLSPTSSTNELQSFTIVHYVPPLILPLYLSFWHHCRSLCPNINVIIIINHCFFFRILNGITNSRSTCNRFCYATVKYDLSPAFSTPSATLACRYLPNIVLPWGQSNCIC